VDNDKLPSSEQSISTALLAGRFLLPIASDPRQDDVNWRHAACWFVAWGLLIGLAYAVVYGVVWKYYGEQHRIRFMPAVGLLAFDLAFGGYRLIRGVASVADSSQGRLSNGPMTLHVFLALSIVVLIKLGILLSLPYGANAYPNQWWHGSVLHWLYPPVIHRPLILMALWGRWGILLAARIGRCAGGCSTRLQRLSEGCSLRVVIVQWVILTVMTTAYCSGRTEHLPWGVMMSLAVMVGAYLAGFFLSIRQGGQTEASVLASGTVAELVFLLAYLPVANAIYWY
jgi:hypothetical protein